MSTQLLMHENIAHDDLNDDQVSGEGFSNHNEEKKKNLSWLQRSYSPSSVLILDPFVLDEHVPRDYIIVDQQFHSQQQQEPDFQAKLQPQAQRQLLHSSKQKLSRKQPLKQQRQRNTVASNGPSPAVVEMKLPDEPINYVRSLDIEARKVHFCMQSIQVHPVLSRDDFTSEEVHAYWHSDTVYRMLRTETSVTCQQARHAENGSIAYHIDNCFNQIVELAQVVLLHNIPDLDFDQYLQRHKLLSNVDTRDPASAAPAPSLPSTTPVLWDYDEARELLKDFRKWTRKSMDCRGLERFIFVKQQSKETSTTDTKSTRSRRNSMAKYARNKILAYFRTTYRQQPSKECASTREEALADFCQQYTSTFRLYARFLGLADAVVGVNAERDTILSTIHQKESLTTLVKDSNKSNNSKNQPAILSSSKFDCIVEADTSSTPVRNHSNLKRIDLLSIHSTGSDSSSNVRSQKRIDVV
jgi:hypothetical protein